MGRRLPPLNSLRAFEATARHLSFTKAAEELHVTPAAVSQQVKTLEGYFDIQLFQRLTRALRLTDTGQAVLPPVRDGFDRLAEVDRILRTREDEWIVAVSVAPSFGAKWLVPRLDRFHRAYPDYDIRIDATDQRVDFTEEDVDIALRYGRGAYPGLCSERLFTESSFPVCSPALLDGEYPLRTPRDLHRHTLLHVKWAMNNEAAPNWRMWLRATGVYDLDTARGPQFNHDQIAVQAAIAGQGVTLASSALVADDLAEGRLVRPFPDADNQPTQFCYYVVYPQAHLRQPKVAAFRDWVMGQAETEETTGW